MKKIKKNKIKNIFLKIQKQKSNRILKIQMQKKISFSLPTCIQSIFASFKGQYRLFLSHKSSLVWIYDIFSLFNAAAFIWSGVNSWAELIKKYRELGGLIRWRRLSGGGVYLSKVHFKDVLRYGSNYTIVFFFQTLVQYS